MRKFCPAPQQQREGPPSSPVMGAAVAAAVARPRQGKGVDGWKEGQWKGCLSCLRAPLPQYSDTMKQAYWRSAINAFFSSQTKAIPMV